VGLGDRSTDELVLLMIVGLLVATTLLTGAGIIALTLLRPDLDMSGAISAFGHITGILAGAVVGYLAGRGKKKTA
jgi:membrane associated rhomboid family serine protease